jgi:hypothetical protein
VSTSSLLNFTVPLSTTDESSSGQGLLMPKIKYRFRILFTSFGVTSPSTMLTKQVIDFKRPTISFNNQEIDIYNSKVHYAGKPEWSDSSITLRDDMQGTVTQLVGEQIQKQFDFSNQASASSAVDYKFSMVCEMLDGGNGVNEPTILETWNLIGCYIKSSDYGDLDYKSSDPATIKLDIVFDNAIQTSGGIGTEVTRTLGTLAI